MSEAQPTGHPTRADERAQEQRLWCRQDALLESWSAHNWADGGVQLETLEDLQTVYVRTENNPYEITVLSRHTGEVLVRGGRFFPERTRVHLAGSSLGGAFLKLRGIYLGFSLEFLHAGRRIVTSRLRSIYVPNEPLTTPAGVV